MQEALVTAQFTDFPSKIKKAMIEISPSVFMTFEEKQKIEIINSQNVTVYYIEACYVDEGASYTNSFEIDETNMRQLISSLRFLQNQVGSKNSLNESIESNGTCGRRVYIKEY